MDYRRSESGLTNTNWASTPPPGQFPVLCPSADNCANSLAGTHYMLIWGNRSPVLLEPLLSGARWSSVGGSGNDVASSSRYLGQTRIKVPAFPQGIGVAKVQTQITQAGALGDPVRHRAADRLLGARRRAGADRAAPRRRRAVDVRARRDEPRRRARCRPTPTTCR